MSTTITIRTDEALRDTLVKRAAAAGKSVSGLVREILEAALLDRSVGARAGHLRGRLTRSGNDSDAWRACLRERNWRS